VERYARASERKSRHHGGLEKAKLHWNKIKKKVTSSPQKQAMMTFCARNVLSTLYVWLFTDIMYISMVAARTVGSV
jgi:hypothetical protein